MTTASRRHRLTGLRWAFGPVAAATPDAHPPRHRRHPHPKGHPDMSFTLTDAQSVPFGVSGKDAAGNPSALTGKPKFAVDDATILTLTDNGDGTGSVKAVGKLGTATLSVVDDETNGKEFLGSVAIDVVGGAVSAVSIDLGTPA